MKAKARNARRSRTTFYQIVEESRVESAARAWERAKLASRLRGYMIRAGRQRAARLLGEIKRRAIERVVELLPRDVALTIDTDFQVGLLSVRWNGHGRLHLPAPVALVARSVAPSDRAAG